MNQTQISPQKVSREQLPGLLQDMIGLYLSPDASHTELELKITIAGQTVINRVFLIEPDKRHYWIES